MVSCWVKQEAVPREYIYSGRGERKEEEKAAVVSSPLLSFSVQTVSPPFKREWEGERRGLDSRHLAAGRHRE